MAIIDQIFVSSGRSIVGGIGEETVFLIFSVRGTLERKVLIPSARAFDAARISNRMR
ncbi:hypothetical protein [Rhizobium ruizarguesonis]|uniref:hypothetical protein n=1 Tax=Rhizobium ruizarguesonis TaxID=2081791 RepID=UPI0013EE5468|nr:hypothetical protein [Rhizobium ruizarguesonis]QIJ44360.1 hypothetical protein G7039_29920 [Rhizobium leguminosarum]